MHRHATFRARHQQVAQTDVGEGAAHHHLVVATTGAVRVEVRRCHTQRLQVARRRGILGDIASRGDVVRGDGVAKHGQRACALNFGDSLRRHGHAVEVGRVAHVRALVIPGVAVAFGHGNGVPGGIAREHARVALLEHGGVDAASDGSGHFLRARPDVLQVDRLAIAPRAERLGGDVLVQRTRQRVSHHERRRSEEVHLYFRVHPAFEVAVARQHRSGDDVTSLHGFRDFRLQWTAVADAGSAAVTHSEEADLLEFAEQTRLGEVVRYDARAGSEAGFHPRLGF